MKISL
ncbi:hypothetical protein E2C01_068700 [Portunus trituberculatus]|jgi:hypothetical protein